SASSSGEYWQKKFEEQPKCIHQGNFIKIGTTGSLDEANAVLIFTAANSTGYRNRGLVAHIAATMEDMMQVFGATLSQFFVHSSEFMQ
ncbi:hypothetical protein Tsubulata_050685, partial [Turnera subulata]